MTRTQSFFTDGAAYERLMGRWSKLVGDDFLDWLALPPGLRWIDLGCGTGVFTAEISQRASPAYLLAIDPAPDQLTYARGRPGLETVDFRVADAQSLPLDDDSFDVAVMALVVHFVPDPRRAVAEMARVLRPGGVAASYAWDYSMKGSPTAPLVDALKSLGFAPPAPPSPNATATSALRELWRSAGFEEIETRVIPVMVTFSNFEEFWGSMSLPVGTAGQAIAQMNSDELKRLRAALEERTHADGNGRVAYQATANAIKGRLPF
jgi:ubiquinone/menaquinone biosynthesis C-methylase UbiE